jgi:hypothetical protein
MAKSSTMKTIEALDEVLSGLAEERIQQVLDFARFLQVRQEQWQRFGAAQLAKAYGPDEPDYTEADIKHQRPTS